MEKLKNLVNPGSKKDDEVMYGSGLSDDPVHSGSTGTRSGQGTHFGSSRTTADDPLSSSTHPTSSDTGLGSKSGNNPLSTSTNLTGNSQYATDSSGRERQGLNEPYASRMPGGFDDDAATTASVRSGVPGHTTHTGSDMTGAHDPSLTNKPLPHEPAGARNELTGPPGNSATEGGYSSGFPSQNNHPGSGIAGTHDTGLTNKPLPHDPTSAGTRLAGSSGNTSAGGSSLTGSNYPDRSANSSGIDDRSAGSSHLGRDAAIGAGAVEAGTAAHHHHESAQRDNYAPETGRSFLLGGNSDTVAGSRFPSDQTGSYPAGGSTSAGPHTSSLANKADPRVDSDLDGSRKTGQTGYGPGSTSGTGPTVGSTHQGSLGRDNVSSADTGIAAGGLPSAGTSGYGPESWEHEHGKHGHQYGGDPCGPGETSAEGPHFVSGPHATDTANRLDPHVAGGIGATESATGHRSHHGEEGALTGGVAGAGLSGNEGRRHHGTTTASTPDTGYSSSNVGTGTSSTGPTSTTSGPHKSDMLNKLDPRVDSDLSKQRGSAGVAGSGLGSSATTGPSESNSSQGPVHQHGGETALGGAGLAAYEGNQHQRRNEPTITDNAPGSTSSENPYPASAVDPRVGNAHSSLQSAPMTETGKDHHLGRDAGLGLGAGGLAYEAERHHGQPSQSNTIPSGTSNSPYDSSRAPSNYDQAGSRIAGSSQQSAATKDHHYGRDAALGAGAGGIAYEAEKHHDKDRSGLASTPQGQLAGSGHQPQVAGNDHHIGRDAAIGGAGLGAGAVGIDESKKFHDTGRMDPGATVREHRHPGDPLATYPSSGYGNESKPKDTGHHNHRREEEALAGGAAAGGLAHHEHSKKGDKAYEKEHAKEIKQHEKEVAKEEKALEKDQKAHEKERAKHMAAIEKDQKKHEHDGEKKKGGLLGFLHREKPDKELKEEETQRAGSGKLTSTSNEQTPGGVGSGAYTDPLAGEHGSQSGVHDTPIGSGITTHDAYGTQEGHNKLHKDPPAKLHQAHGADYQGHGNVT